MMGIEQVAAAEWSAWISETGGTLVDVREPHEWRLGTLPGATLISLADSTLGRAVNDVGRIA